MKIDTDDAIGKFIKKSFTISVCPYEILINENYPKSFESTFDQNNYFLEY
jgi:hypothetical protein